MLDTNQVDSAGQKITAGFAANGSGGISGFRQSAPIQRTCILSNPPRTIDLYLRSKYIRDFTNSIKVLRTFFDLLASKH